ncbi:unnamed protein product [Mytilus coruscus]|uniref:Uncharacterized protein n=1 Tax=Mytilus coruscus TaxID=42192 RepID=A0A6J8AH60_MYTCO|nr:unnamed protein product [Mytilus coruscus]
MTPLMMAAGGGHLEVVRYLVTHGSQLAATSRDGMTPLMLAAGGGHLEVVRYLVTQGSQLAATDYVDGLTALHWAAQYGGIDTTKWLIDQGCSPWVKTQKKEEKEKQLVNIEKNITSNRETDASIKYSEIKNIISKLKKEKAIIHYRPTFHQSYTTNIPSTNHTLPTYLLPSIHYQPTFHQSYTANLPSTKHTLPTYLLPSIHYQHTFHQSFTLPTNLPIIQIILPPIIHCQHTFHQSSTTNLPSTNHTLPTYLPPSIHYQQ